MRTPKDLTVETRFIGNWLILTVGFTVRFESLCLEPIRRNSVFVIFKVSLLAASHTRILSKSEKGKQQLEGLQRIRNLDDKWQ